MKRRGFLGLLGLAPIQDVEQLRDALKTARQALMEVQHAQESGPGWYTKGESGMYQQTTMWVRRGLTAAREALEALGE
jgi:hypothetical protein